MYQTEDVGPTSLYRHNSGSEKSYPRLTGRKQVEVVVIGGGLLGLSTALHLSEAGSDVAVLEARQPGWGSGGRNGGQLNTGLKYDPNVIEKMFGKERGKQIIKLGWSGPDFTISLIRRLGLNCDARQNGTLRAAIHGRVVENLRETAANWQCYGIDVRLLDSSAVALATGTDRYQAAMFDPRGGDVNPLKLIRGLAAAASAAGAKIYGESEVTSLVRRGGAWIVETPAGSLTADRVLVATNAYTDNLLPDLRRSVVPVFGAIAATEPLSEELAATILPTRPVLYETGNIVVYYRIDTENRLLIGGRGPMKPLNSADVLPNLTDYARRLWPQLGQTRWTHAWNGRVAMTVDHLPHFHNPDDGLFACVGCNGRGVSLSISLGADFATLLGGGVVEDFPIPVTPVAPIPFHQFWPVGAKITIWKGRIMDRLGL